MQSVVELKMFRGADGGSALCCAPTTSIWCCGDNLGAIQKFDTHSWVPDDVADGENITAFAINQDGSQCAISYANAIHIHEYPNVKNMITECIYRADGNLGISKIEYDCSGKYL